MTESFPDIFSDAVSVTIGDSTVTITFLLSDPDDEARDFRKVVRLRMATDLAEALARYLLDPAADGEPDGTKQANESQSPAVTGTEEEPR